MISDVRSFDEASETERDDECVPSDEPKWKKAKEKKTNDQKKKEKRKEKGDDP